MPRDYAKVSTTIHRSKRFRALPSDDARYVYLMILASPDGNSVGAFHLDPEQFAAAIRWPVDRTNAALAELATAHTAKGPLIHYDEDEEEVVIADYLRHDPIHNADHLSRARKLVAALQSDRLRELAFSMLDDAAVEVSPARGGRPRKHPQNTVGNAPQTPYEHPQNTGVSASYAKEQERQKSAILKTSPEHPENTGVNIPETYPEHSYTDTDTDTEENSKQQNISSAAHAPARGAGEGAAGSSSDGESVREVIQAFDEAIAGLWGESQRRPNPAHRDSATAREMILAAKAVPGLDPVGAVAIAIDECLSGRHQAGSRPPTTLRYCLPAVLDAIGKAKALMHDGPTGEQPWEVAFKRFGAASPEFAPIHAALSNRDDPDREAKANSLASEALNVRLPAAAE